MSEPKEKRKKPRYSARLFASIESEFNSNLGRGVVTDVSLSGFGIETEVDLSHGQTVTCHVEIPLKLKASVVRTNNPGQMKRYGLRFTNQSFVDRFFLKRMLNGLLQTSKV